MKRLLFAGVLLCGLFAGPHQTTHAQTTIDPTSFKLSIWSFPRPAQVVQSQVESNAAADAEPLIIHYGPAWDQAGRVSGYFAEVGQLNLTASGKEHPVLTQYLVSSFTTVAQATAAFQAEHQGWENLVTLPTSTESVKVLPFPAGQQPGDQAAEGLYLDTITTSQGNVDLQLLLFQRGQYVIEVWQAFLPADLATYGTADQPYIFSIAAQLDAIANGQTPPALPAHSVKFNLLSVRFEKNNSKGDLTVHPLTRVKVGSKVYMSVYFAVNDAPPGAKFSDDFKLTHAGHTFHKVYHHTFGSYPPDYYRYYLFNVKLTQTGRYKFTGTLTVNGVAKRGTAYITVTGHSSARSLRVQYSHARLGQTPAARDFVSTAVRAMSNL